MKKLFLLLALISVSAILSAQPFQVRVFLQGNCVTPDQNTYYKVRVDVEENSTIVATTVSTTTSTSYNSSNGIIVQLPSFCTADNTKKYIVHIEAAKVYLSPPSIICYNKKTISDPYSCDDFINVLIDSGYLTLQ